MKHFIAGNGEIGSAIKEVLSDKYDVVAFNKEGTEGTCDVLHICFPHSSSFEWEVEEAVTRYAPGLTIIHSTVPVGTTDRLATSIRIVHSPVRGVHPNLTEGVRTFTKYFGGEWSAAKEAAEIFREVGVRADIWPSARDTELAKLLSTTYYGIAILFQKHAKRLSDKHGTDYHRVYEKWNDHYNEGYQLLGMPNVTRPVLKNMPGKIGGHCVQANWKLLGGTLGWLARIWHKIIT